MKDELEMECDLKLVEKKLSNLVQNYKGLKDPPSGVSTEDGAATPITWPFYDAMDEVLHVISPPLLISSADLVQRSPESAASTSSPQSSSDWSHQSPHPGPSPSLEAAPNASQEASPTTSPQPRPSSSVKRTRKAAYDRAAYDRKRDKRQKALLEQNNRMLVLLKSFIVISRGKSLGSEVEVPFESSDED